MELMPWWERQKTNKETNESSQIVVCCMKNSLISAVI